MILKKIRIPIVIIATTIALYSCVPVKEYQKSRLNDGEMELSSRQVQKTEQNFQSYREGASGANGGKTGGGCGCN
jgi:hypothetical protein